jgi:RND superfamily putative drug exporter
MENSKILRRFGEWVAHHRWTVIIIWLIALMGVGGAVGHFGTKYSANLAVDGLPSLTVADQVNEVFGQNQEDGTLRVVIEAKQSQKMTDPAEMQRIITTLTEIQSVSAHVTNVSNPYEQKTISADMTTVFADVTFDQKASEVDEKVVQSVEKTAKQLADHGYNVDFTGNVLAAVEVGTTAEIIGMAVAFVLLLILFGRIVAAGLPLITAIFGLGVALLGFGLSTQFFEITNTAVSLATMLGLAVGIDYGLFVLHRYREIMQKPVTLQQAIGQAVGTAGSAVVFAGVTVIIAVLGLSLIGFDFITQMGIAAALAALFAVLSAITLMPALISLLSRWILPKHVKDADSTQPNLLGRLLVKAPWLYAIAAILVLIMLAMPVGHMRYGMPTDGQQPTHTTQRQAYDILADKFGEGFNSQLVVLAQVDSPQDAQKAYQAISEVDDVAMVTPPQVKDGYALLVAIPKEGPNAPSTEKIVHAIRDIEINQQSLGVAGTAAANIDIVEKLNDAIPKFAGLIMVLAFILLMVVYRSFLIPLVAMIGFGLSLLAALGVVTLVVQDGHWQDVLQFSGATPILAFLPVIVIGVLFGLAMDYEVFLMSRIHEYYQDSGNNRQAVLKGLKSATPVIVTAALIMFAVFSSFVFTPDPIVKSLGLALGVGVLFDAFIVRLVLVPALTLLFGNANWWFFNQNKKDVR